MKVVILFLYILVISFGIDKSSAQSISNVQKNIFSTIDDNSPQHYKWYRLYPGDIMPNENYTFKDIKNYPQKELRWSDLKSKKLVILDFWTKYCSSCISSFPKMEQLQKEFGNDIQIILITYNTRHDLKSLFENSYNVKNTTLPMIFGDSLFNFNLFPHNGVPYHVWIGEGNHVIATVHSSETNSENIKTYLEGTIPDMIMRHDVVERESPDGAKDSQKSILTYDNGRLINNIIYYAQIPERKNRNNPTPPNFNPTTGKLPMLTQYSVFLNEDPGFVFGGTIEYIQNQTGDNIGLKMYNVHLSNILRTAYRELWAQLKTPVLNSGKEIWIDSSAIKLLETKNTNSTMLNSYFHSLKYSYESIMKDFSDKKSETILKEDINRCFGLKLKLELRPYKCVVFFISDSSKLKNIWSDTKDETIPYILENNEMTEYKNSAWNSLIGQFRINSQNSTTSPIIQDATGLIKSKNKINITIPTKLLSLEDNKSVLLLQKAMNPYGISVRIETRNDQFLSLYSEIN